jgi:hypothetical protein
LQEKKWVSLVLITFLMVFVLGPVNYASADAIDDVVTEVERLYSFADKDYEEFNIPALEDAREKLDDLTNDQLDEIAGPLVTPQVTAKYQDNLDLYDKSEWNRVITKLMAFTYLGDSDTDKLKTDLDEFREEFSPHFKILFGDGITMDDLARLAQDTRGQIRSVIGNAGAGILANDSNEVMIEKMAGYSFDALDAAAEIAGNEMFANKLADLGWDKDLLIQQLDILAEYIDEDGDARRSLALMIIRSETDPIEDQTVDIGDPLELTVTIMGENASSFIGWYSTDDSVVKVTETPQGYDIEAVGKGEAELLAYRYYPGDGSASEPLIDWLVRVNVTVESDILYGDVNGDGQVTNADLTTLKRYFAGVAGTVINELNSDVNADGEITNSDLIILKRYFAGVTGTVLGPQ